MVYTHDHNLLLGMELAGVLHRCERISTPNLCKSKGLNVYSVDAAEAGRPLMLVIFRWV